jgi:hypothetical protein
MHQYSIMLNRACVAASVWPLPILISPFFFQSLTYLLDLVGCLSTRFDWIMPAATSKSPGFVWIYRIGHISLHPCMVSYTTRIIRAIGTIRRIVPGSLRPRPIDPTPVPLLTTVLKNTCLPCRLTGFLGVDFKSFAVLSFACLVTCFVFHPAKFDLLYFLALSLLGPRGWRMSKGSHGVASILIISSEEL